MCDMPDVKRIFVEKKMGFDIEATHLYNDLKENLGIANLEHVKIINRYDIEGISEEHYQLSKHTIFSEPPVDRVYEEAFPATGAVFAVEYLPGQYDQRADSAMQCIQIITGKEKPQIAAAKVYVLQGELSDDEVTKIKKFLINPVDSREASLSKPASLKMDVSTPPDIEQYDGFILKSRDDVFAMRDALQLAMSGNDLLFCQTYFKETEKRDPTVTEIKVIDTYWSDHCRHTTFLTNIEHVQIEEGFYKAPIEDAFNLYMAQRKKLYVGKDKNICLMDIAVMGMKVLKNEGSLDNLDESDEINACSIVVDVDVDGKDEEWLVMFKNETHNHPTEIEPFGGAATCLGGAIRDPLSGRSYVYQAMRVTGSGDPRTLVSDTIPGKLPQRKITTEAAHGYSSYGNQIGLATGIVREIYHEGYVAKRMEIGAVVGAAKKSHVIRNVPEKGDIIILVGGQTGRDGCGGATGSSKLHTEDSILTCGAEVQKGNAPVERKLQRLFRNEEASRLIKRCNDFGAGGVSVAIGELAEGLVMNLDAVPKKYDGLDGTELAISESQERMAVVVSACDVEQFIQLSNDENLEATVVATVTDDRRLQMLWRNKAIVNISRDFLDTNGATQHTDVFVSLPKGECLNHGEPAEGEQDLRSNWLANLSQLNVAAQKGLSERFDSTIGSNTVLMPFGGKEQLTPIEAMAAKIPMLKGETTTATLMSFGYDPFVSSWSPFHGAVYAVVESVSKIVATGGTHHKIRLTFQEYFESLGKDATKWGKPFGALLGSFYAQMKLQIPSIGGKDSMSGTFKDMTVPPTLVSFALDVCKTSNIISPEFKGAGNKIVLLHTAFDAYNLPDFGKLIENYKKLETLIADKNVLAAHTIGIGGIAAVISKMCFGNKIGVTIDVPKENLFQPQYGSFILEMPGTEERVGALLDGCAYTILGETTALPTIVVNATTIDMDEAIQAWLSPLEKIFPTMLLEETAVASPKALDIKPYKVTEKKGGGVKLAKPRAFVPIFPGTNCEYDTIRALEKAGAVVDSLVIRNLNVSWLEASIMQMADTINQSQIIVLPGGFSAGDEPEGSGKFIAAVFKNAHIKEAVMNLLNNRDGLMLGICNGFQALIKLGLLPYGEIKDINEHSPTLTFNTIGRHISRLTDTKIVSNLSPWIWNVSVGDVHKVALSHGEGRFVCDDETVQALAASGQIATQYVNEAGNASYNIKDNPNGSTYAIEGITSPDGRVFGKMGHSERIGNDVYKNVVGEKDQKIFAAGVHYFC